MRLDTGGTWHSPASKSHPSRPGAGLRRLPAANPATPTHLCCARGTDPAAVAPESRAGVHGPVQGARPHPRWRNRGLETARGRRLATTFADEVAGSVTGRHRVGRARHRRE